MFFKKSLTDAVNKNQSLFGYLIHKRVPYLTLTPTLTITLTLLTLLLSTAVNKEPVRKTLPFI